jgi:hypothetical protein
MPFRIASGKCVHASMISIRSGSPLLLSWIPGGASGCLIEAFTLFLRGSQVVGAGLKIRSRADEEFATDVRTFNERRASPPAARAAVFSSMSSPATNHRRRPSSATAEVTKSTSTKASGSGFDGRSLPSPRRKVSWTIPFCAPYEASVDQTDARKILVSEHRQE